MATNPHLPFSLTVLATLLFIHASAASAAPEKTKAPSLEKNRYRNYLSVSYENDLIGSGTDEYYTSGVQINIFNIDEEPPRFLQGFADDLLGFDISRATAVSFTLGQKIFTPQDISVAAAQPNDRPWAGWLYTGVSLANLYADHIDQLGMTVGLVGPGSLAEPVQKFVHQHLTDSPRPQGWDNQLHAEPGFILSWSRRWHNYASADLSGYRVQAEPNISLALGNVHTHAGAGITLTLGETQLGYQDTPPRILPAMPGSGYFDLPEGKSWDWFLFAGLNGRAVARDIFLDGNSFLDSASVDKKALVADANAGVAFTCGQARVSYTIIYRSREFDGQDDPSIFGSLSASYRF